MKNRRRRLGCGRPNLLSPRTSTIAGRSIAAGLEEGGGNTVRGTTTELNWSVATALYPQRQRLRYLLHEIRKNPRDALEVRES